MWNVVYFSTYSPWHWPVLYVLLVIFAERVQLQDDCICQLLCPTLASSPPDLTDSKCVDVNALKRKTNWLETGSEFLLAGPRPSRLLLSSVSHTAAHLLSPMSCCVGCRHCSTAIFLISIFAINQIFGITARWDTVCWNLTFHNFSFDVSSVWPVCVMQS